MNKDLFFTSSWFNELSHFSISAWLVIGTSFRSINYKKEI